MDYQHSKNIHIYKYTMTDYISVSEIIDIIKHFINIIVKFILIYLYELK